MTNPFNVSDSKIYLEALGAEVEWPSWNQELFEKAKEDGFLYDGQPILDPGTPGLCQDNASQLCEENKRYRIWLGWALGKRGEWVAHVCAYDLDTDTLIEATTPREKYFGIVLDDDDTEMFLLESRPLDLC